MSIITVVTILTAGIVIWWFVKPGSSGIQLVTGLFADATTTLRAFLSGS